MRQLTPEEIPERGLWAAVMHQAVTDIEVYGTPHERRSAIAWVQSDRAAVGSFLWCCSLFNIYPDRVRSKLGLA